MIRQGRRWKLQVQVCTDGGRRSRQVSVSAREVRRVRTVRGGTVGGREGLRIECHLADEHELAGLSGDRMETSAGQDRATRQVWQEGGPHDDNREGRGAKRRASPMLDRPTDMGSPSPLAGTGNAKARRRAKRMTCSKVRDRREDHERRAAEGALPLDQLHRKERAEPYVHGGLDVGRAALGRSGGRSRSTAGGARRMEAL